MDFLDFWIGFIIADWHVLLLCASIIAGAVCAFRYEDKYCVYEGARPYIISIAVKRSGDGDPDRFFKQYKLYSQFANVYEDIYKNILRREGILDMYGVINVSDIRKAGDILYNFRTNFLTYALA